MEQDNLTRLKTKIDNFSEATPVTEYQIVVRILVDTYKEQIAGVLNAGTSPTLATKRANVEAAAVALLAELNIPTNVLKK